MKEVENIEYLVEKKVIDFLFLTIQQLAAKVGIEIANHGAHDVIQKIKTQLIEHKCEHKEKPQK